MTLIAAYNYDLMTGLAMIQPFMVDWVLNVKHLSKTLTLVDPDNVVTEAIV